MDEVAESGKEIVITEYGRPVPRLVPRRILDWGGPLERVNAREYGLDRDRAVQNAHAGGRPGGRGGDC